MNIKPDHNGNRSWVNRLSVNQPRVAIVATHPIQHFCPLYRALASSGKVTLRVLFASTAGQQPYYDPGFGQVVQFQDDLTTGFDHEYLPGHQAGAEPSGKIKNRHVGERLTAFDPDVVHVYGYHHPLSRDAMTWARQARRPVLYCSDSELLYPGRLWKRAIKRMLLPRIFAECAGFLTVGDCNSDYYRHYGVTPDRLFRCPFPIDDARLSRAVEGKSHARRALLGRFDLPSDAIVALVVGKLTVRKAPAHAIRAVSQAWNSGLKNKLFLVLAGSGPELDNLKALAACEPGAIRFAGFVEVSDLPSYYAAADVLIHPSSQDPHPLAVSEAVFCGLPVIVSDRVGIVGPTDDVRLGMNGLQYKYGDVDRLTQLLVHFCGHPQEAERMRESSRRFGSQRTLEVSAQGYLNAVMDVVGGKATAIPSARDTSTHLNSSPRASDTNRVE